MHQGERTTHLAANHNAQSAPAIVVECREEFCPIDSPALSPPPRCDAGESTVSVHAGSLVERRFEEFCPIDPPALSPPPRCDAAGVEPAVLIHVSGASSVEHRFEEFCPVSVDVLAPPTHQQVGAPPGMTQESQPQTAAVRDVARVIIVREEFCPIDPAPITPPRPPSPPPAVATVRSNDVVVIVREEFCPIETERLPPPPLPQPKPFQRQTEEFCLLVPSALTPPAPPMPVSTTDESRSAKALPGPADASPTHEPPPTSRNFFERLRPAKPFPHKPKTERQPHVPKPQSASCAVQTDWAFIRRIGDNDSMRAHDDASTMDHTSDTAAPLWVISPTRSSSPPRSAGPAAQGVSTIAPSAVYPSAERHTNAAHDDFDDPRQLPLTFEASSFRNTSRDVLDAYFPAAALINLTARRKHYMRELLRFYLALTVSQAEPYPSVPSSFAAHHLTTSANRAGSPTQRTVMTSLAQTVAHRQIQRIPSVLDMFSGNEDDLYKLLRAKYQSPWYRFDHYDPSSSSS